MRSLLCALSLGILLCGCGREVKFEDKARELAPPTSTHDLWLSQAAGGDRELEPNNDRIDHEFYERYDREILIEVNSEADLRHKVSDPAWKENVEALDDALEDAASYLPSNLPSAKQRWFERGQYNETVYSFQDCDRCRKRSAVCDKCHGAGVIQTRSNQTVREVVDGISTEIEDMLHGAAESD